MRVKVFVRDHELEISSSNGQQTFKWLASVIQNRLKHYNLLQKSLEPDAYLVTEIRNMDNELINPKDRIYEHTTSNGLEVKAILSNSFPVDDWENPKFNDWMQVAYLHSVPNQNWAKEMEVWRQNLQDIKSNPNDPFGFMSDPTKSINYNTTLLAAKATPQSARLIKIGFDFTEADVELAFNLDWQIMEWSWLGSSLNEHVRVKLGDIIKLNYSLICNIFAHYAGVGKVGQRFGMTLEEFGHFLHFMRVYDLKQTEETIESVVFQTMSEKERIGNSDAKAVSRSESKRYLHEKKDRWPLMTRAHFTESLVCVALKENMSSTPDLAIKSFLEGPINDFWDSITSKYIKYTCPESALKQSFQEYYHLLRQVFHQRATMDSKFGPKLSLSDFLSLMREATLIDYDSENFCVSCFLQAQLNPSVQLELENIVFIEFIEAVSRLSLKAIENYSGLTEAKRIRMAFNLIIELPTNSDAKY